ncbi:MAG: PaaI family thioesterase [Bacteroidales bacterium]|nr:PaaI family thioesterase [Bacteroidales bacterium]
MRKIINPYTNLEGYNCFGCSSKNELGLQMEFYEEGDFIVSRWEPKAHLSGYGNVLHGGIQSTIHDEIASWVVYTKVKTAGVTANLNVKYKYPVFTNKGALTIRAKIIDQNKRFATIHTELLDHNENVCSEAEVKYFIFPLEIAKRKFHYPGAEAFFEQ